MAPFDLLSSSEKELIDVLRRDGVDVNDDFIAAEYSDCEYFLRFWNENKASIFKNAFKDTLILKKKINTVISDEELTATMDQAMYRTSDYVNVKTKIFKMLERYNDLDHRFQDPSSVFGTTIRFELRHCVFSMDSLVNNKYTGATLELNMPDGSIFKLVNGCKLMKTIGRLAKAAGCLDEFEKVRIAQSQVMNEANLSATLCLSIHPLDYMTASYNDNDWRSCMNWFDGEYRRGVIEMMNSPYVVVAYLASNRTKMDFWTPSQGSVNWNSKRWREFFIVHPDLGIFGIKGYPYWNRNLEDTTLRWLSELFSSNGDNQYSKEITNWEVGSPLIDSSVESNFSVSMQCGPAMYNDFYSENVYHAILKANVIKDYTAYVDYSGESECVVCGEDRDFDDASEIGCNYCIEQHSCWACGSPFNNSEEIFELDGKEYCECCFYNLPSCCCCDERVDDNTDNGFTFCIGGMGENSDFVLRDQDNNQVLVFTVCRDCAENIFEDGVQEFNFTHKYYSSWYMHTAIVPFNRIKHLDPLEISQEDLDYFLCESIKGDMIKDFVK